MAKVLSNEFSNAQITGVGIYDENKSDSDRIESTTPNLKLGATYLILPQIAHLQPRMVNNPDGTTKDVQSKRFGAIEFVNDEVTNILSVGVSALRAYYISDDIDCKPIVKMEVRQDGRACGLHRPIFGQDFHVTTLDKPAPIDIEVNKYGAKTIAMTKPFAFKVVGRRTYWQFLFHEEEDGRYDMLVDDNMNAKVQQRRDYVLETAEIPDGKYDIKSFIPQLADYAL